MLSLFQGHGIELEYMIVDAESLRVAPLCDRLLAAAGDDGGGVVDFDDIGWSRELARHVVELKTSGPVAHLAGVAEHFNKHILRMESILRPMGALLLPGAMHPWMDPEHDFQVWPHEGSDVYDAFDRIFGCKGHGWSNLQSMHINLPFANDDEFARLHTAMRLVMPIIPALSASSPFREGKFVAMDTRLMVYRDNAKKIPSVSGLVIPDLVLSQAAYQTQILDPIYRDMAPFDPEGVLAHEWVNARGCIARFDRMAIEMRVIDVQECPAADLAIASLVTAVIKALVEERFSSANAQQALSTPALAALLERSIRDAECAVIDDSAYLRALGLSSVTSMSAGEIWRDLAKRVADWSPDVVAYSKPLQVILREGPLARRLVKSAGESPSRASLKSAYTEMASCLSKGTMFGAIA